MRLQTENRRKSQISNLSLDLSAGQPGLAQQAVAGAGAGAITSSWASATPKRASFAPLTGSPAGRMGHRRISSVSDSGLTSPNFAMQGQWPNSPSADAYANHRRTTLLGRSSLLEGGGVDGEEMDALRRELAVAREQLEEMKHELTETQEAREASELCVKALRTFISENSVGMAAPGSSSGGKGDSGGVGSGGSGGGGGVGARGGPASKWGFNFWKVDTSSEGAEAGAGRVRSNSNNLASPASATSSTATPGGSTPAAAAPFSKLGSLFGSRVSTATTTTTTASASASSTTSSSVTTGHMVHQEPMFNGSDTSSVAESTPEPISPASELKDRHALMFPEDEKETYEDIIMDEGHQRPGAVEF